MEPRKKTNPPELPTEMKELEHLATPLVEWVRTTYGFNTEVRISASFVQVTHDGIGIPYPITEK